MLFRSQEALQGHIHPGKGTQHDEQEHHPGPDQVARVRQGSRQGHGQGQREIGQTVLQEGPAHHGHDQGHGHGHDHGHGEQDPHNVNRHDDRIKAFCMTFDEPMSWSTVAAAFDALVTYRGPDLLRMKGILNVKDTDKPVVIHGVQHVFHPPATLEAWPEGDDRKSRVVFITRDIAESTIRKVFASFFDAEKKGWGQGEQQQQQ